MTFIPSIYGKLSSSNSGALSTAIGVGFTGTYELATNYSSAAISTVIGSNEQVTITINYSVNVGGSVKTVESISVTGPETHIIPIKSQYFQIIVTNVTTVTSGSEIQTIFNTTMKMPIEPISRTIQNDSDTILTKSVLYSKTETNLFSPVISTTSGSINSNITGPLDAFNRVRTSNGYALFSSSLLTTNDPWNFDTLISGSGATTYNQGYPHVALTVNGTGRAVRQQHGYSIYQPGKSLLILMTGTIINSTAPNTCTGRIGYFDDSTDKNAVVDDSPTGDGFFFQAVGNGTSNPTMSIVYRTSNRISGAIVQTDTVISRSSWNIDPLDGTGPSGVNVNFTNRQIYIAELEWLGVGDVVLGVFYNRKPLPCHKFNFTGGEYAPLGPGSTSYPQLAYITRGSLPVRYELTSTAGAATMYQICSAVSSEGGFEPIGRKFSGPRATRAASNNIESQVYALRLNRNTNYPMRPRTNLRINDISIICTTTGNVAYNLYFYKDPYLIADPVTGGAWVNGSVVTNGIKYSAAEVNITPTGTGAPSSATYDVKCVYSGIFSSNVNQSFLNFNEPIIVSSDISGDSDVFLVTCTPIAANETVHVSITWEEIE